MFLATLIYFFIPSQIYFSCMVTAIETHCNLHLSLEWNLHGDEIEMSCPSSTQQTSDKKGKNIYETVQPKRRLSLRRFTVIIQQRWGVKRNVLPTFSNAIQVAMIINKTTISTDTECNFMSTVVGIRCRCPKLVDVILTDVCTWKA